MSHIRCVLHGSFSRHIAEIQRVQRLFTSVGVEVLAPKIGELTSEDNGFALFADEAGKDPRLIELEYLHNLKRLGSDGFSYFVNPGGYIGKSAAYELGIAQLANVRCFFQEKLDDHPAYQHGNSVWKAENLADYIYAHGSLPEPYIRPNDHAIHKLWSDLMVPGSVVATGAIIEHQRPRNNLGPKEILLVKTHKWGGRYSIVGGKVKRNELLSQALLREVSEETGLNGEIGRHLCTFDQIKDSGYYQRGIQHIFVDNVVKVQNKRVVLNDEAQGSIWITAEDALTHLDIEPNARMTVELYAQSA